MISQPVLAIVAALGMLVLAGHEPRIEELWQDPADLAARDLFAGPWGAANAPDPSATYTFEKKKTNGSAPGMVVHDPRGREWHVKQGREGPPEVVVSRILSAVGYHQPPVYFLPSFSVAAGLASKVEPGGRFRLSLKGVKHRGTWSWEDNPFAGTRPYQGLLVILVLLNSADLKNVNNALYEVKNDPSDVHRWFVVRDLGTSLGDTRRVDPVPNDPRLFVARRFIAGISLQGYVRFDYRAVHDDLLRHITPDDVAWASRLLSGLSDAQWHDAFRAGAYSPGEAEVFITCIRRRIEEGLRLEF